jgi:hypothetical protein
VLWVPLALSLLAAEEPAAATVSAAAEQADPCEQVSPDGEPFSVCFNPGRGIQLTAGALARDSGGTGSVAPVYGAVIMYRTQRPSRSKEKEQSLWFNTHRFFDTRAQTDEAAKSVLVTAYEATLRRHIEEGFILIPTSSPVRLPFPFDVVLDVGAMRYERRVFEGPGYTLELAHMALLFDPIRSIEGRYRLGFGPALSDTFRVLPGALVNEVSPFSSIQVDAGFETENGWWAGHLNAVSGWVYIPGASNRFRTRAVASLQRVLVAVNNQPLDLVLSSFGSINDAGVQHRSELGVSLGLAIRPLGRY